MAKHNVTKLWLIYKKIAKQWKNSFTLRYEDNQTLRNKEK